MKRGALVRATATGALLAFVLYGIAFAPLLMLEAELAPAPSEPVAAVFSAVTALFLVVFFGAFFGAVACLIAVEFSAPDGLYRRARIAAALVCGLLFGGFALKHLAFEPSWAMGCAGAVGLVYYVLAPWTTQTPVVRADAPVLQAVRPVTRRRLLLTVGAAWVGLLLAQDLILQLTASGILTHGVLTASAVSGVLGALVAGSAAWFTLPERS